MSEKEFDHKKLGKELELFTFSDTVGKGLPLWLPKGATIRREIERFIIDEETRRGYQHVYTPDIAKLELYEKSGHYPHYKESMYAPIEVDDERFMLRPMTCPHHFEMYLSRPRSYRELPMRIAEFSTLYRYEQSGELMGLQRVRNMHLSDAHIICATEEQAVEEAGKALDLIEYVAGVFGLKVGESYTYRLSLGDRANEEKYYKDDAGWDKAEDLLRKLMKGRGVPFTEEKDEAAFYGPKIDIQMTNVNGKEDTVFTVQYDLSSSHKFDMTYLDSDGEQKPVFIIHRSSIGTIERHMAFLIEFYRGAFPLWLSPTQVKVLPVSSDKHGEYASEIYEKLKEENIRAELDNSSESLGKKIRNAKTEKVPYLIIIGDKEKDSGILTLEGRGDSKDELSLEDTISKLKEEIKNKNT